LCRARPLIETFFAELKRHRAIATRYDERAVHCLGAIHLAATVSWLD
jgi:transposase